MVSALIIWKLHSPQRYYADPAVSLAISLIIFVGALPMSTLQPFCVFAADLLIWSSAMKSGRILLEATPLYLDLEKVKDDLLAV